MGIFCDEDFSRGPGHTRVTPGSHSFYAVKARGGFRRASGELQAGFRLASARYANVVRWLTGVLVWDVISQNGNHEAFWPTRHPETE